MRYIIDVDSDTSQGIEELIQKKKYSTIRQFLEAAIHNQLLLETNSQNKSESRSISSKTYLSTQISNVNVRTISPPNDNHILIDRPLWGLVNRLLPIKVGLRLLATLLSESNTETISYEEFKIRAYTSVCELGRKLQRYDKSKKNMTGKSLRGEEIAAGLPDDESNEKSKDRFFSQFIGRVQKNEFLEGAACTLKMVDISLNNKNQPYIGITDRGLEFARIRNPVLDEQSFDKALSSEEVEFLLNVFEEMIGEKRGIICILDGIKRGENNTEKLTSIIQKEFSYKNQDVANSARVGLIGRLIEIGLVTRQQNGLNVLYQISEKGSKWLEQHSTGK